MQRWGLQGVKSRGRGKPEKILCAKPYVSSPLGRNPTGLKIIWKESSPVSKEIVYLFR